MVGKIELLYERILTAELRITFAGVEVPAGTSVTLDNHSGGMIWHAPHASVTLFPAWHRSKSYGLEYEVLRKCRLQQTEKLRMSLLRWFKEIHLDTKLATA